MTDVELDERVTALEESGGIVNGKVIKYETLCKQSAFDILLLQTFFYLLIFKANTSSNSLFL